MSTIWNKTSSRSASARADAANYDMLHQGNIDATMADITTLLEFQQGRDGPPQPFPSRVSSASVSGTPAHATQELSPTHHRVRPSLHRLVSGRTALDELQETMEYFAALVLR